MATIYKRSYFPHYEKSKDACETVKHIDKLLEKYFREFDTIINEYPRCCRKLPLNIHKIWDDTNGWDYCTSYLSNHNKDSCLRIIFFIHPIHHLLIFYKIVADHDYNKVEKAIRQHMKQLLKDILAQEKLITW